MDVRELDEVCPDSEHAACAFRMARAGVGARESLRASNEPSWPFRETDRRGRQPLGAGVVVAGARVVGRRILGACGEEVL